VDRQAQLNLWSGETGPQEQWQVRESRRARRLSVRVCVGGRVDVVVPVRTSRRTVQSFLDRHREWIERQREKARTLGLPTQPFPPQRIELAAAGQTLRVHLTGGAGKPRVKRLAPDLIAIAGSTGNTRAATEALQLWLMKTARETLSPMLAAAARETGLAYRKLCIRRQRTRWGSCSSRGTISLNCCLLFQPPEVVRYLLIHELTHTAHMNHSARFWRTVEQQCPDYRRLDRELLDGWRRVPGWMMQA
jgi:hypothetical protein